MENFMNLFFVLTIIYCMYIAEGVNAQIKWENARHDNVRAIVGNRKIGKRHVDITVERDGNKCRHRDSIRRVEVFDACKSTSTAEDKTDSTFECDRAADDHWDYFVDTDAYSPRNEVYDHAIKFVDMWKELIEETDKIYKTSTSFLKFYVHYGREDDEVNADKARFDEEVFTFGDGKKYYPQTSIDIVCHEIGHAVTKWKGSQLQTKGEAGAINEAYSDILGETCDIHYHNKEDALIGAEVTKGDETAMRHMCDPPSIGTSVDHFERYDDRDVHRSAGIYNKAWCELKNRPGWDYKKAFQVFTKANLRYWGKKTTMHCGACGVEKAAAALGYDKGDVTAAFDVVGVSCASAPSCTLRNN